MLSLAPTDVALASDSNNITSPTAAQTLNSGTVGVDESPRSPLSPSSSLRETPISCLEPAGLEISSKIEEATDSPPPTLSNANKSQSEELIGPQENGSDRADLILQERNLDTNANECIGGEDDKLIVPRAQDDSSYVGGFATACNGSFLVPDREQDDSQPKGNAHVHVANNDSVSGKASSSPQKKQVKCATQQRQQPTVERKRPPTLRNGHQPFESNSSRKSFNHVSPKVDRGNDARARDDEKCNLSEGRGKIKKNNTTPRSLHISPARVFLSSPSGSSPGSPHGLLAGSSSPRIPVRGSSLRPSKITPEPAEKLQNLPGKAASSKSVPVPLESGVSTPKSIASSAALENKLVRSKIVEAPSDRERVQRKVKEFLLRNKTVRTFGSSKSKGDGLADDNLTQIEDSDMGPFLLKHAKSAIASGEDPYKALEFAVRAAKSFERSCDGFPSLDYVRCMHILAAIHCRIGQFEEAVPVLQQAIAVLKMDAGGLDFALAEFSGHMQLGDTFALLGRSEDALAAYHAGLEVQKRALGDMDPRVGDTCRYIAEAHAQAMQFAKAEDLCEHALEIHKEHSPPASLEEATDRRLMGLILHGKGEYQAALEHLVLASMALIANEQEVEVAAVDVSIGDTYTSLGRFDEAIFSYQKALTVFKSAKGESHACVASVYISLAELYLKTGKLRESRTYCDSALRIYCKEGAEHQLDEIASGLTELAAVYEALNEQKQALSLFLKALVILESAPGQQFISAGIEAQVGVLYYIMENFKEACTAFQNAVSKLRACAENKFLLLGVVLNQLGLAFVQLSRVDEAAKVFEEARDILEESLGPYHPDTLAVCGNLAGAYDGLGRLNEAVNLLEYIVETREEKLGTANPEVDDERRRLAELLKEAGRARARRQNGSLELLMQYNTKQTAESGYNISSNEQGRECTSVQRNISVATCMNGTFLHQVNAVSQA